MPADRRVYFDQAATSWPKLPAAVAAAESYIRECGATAGRGAYSSARVAERWVANARMWTAKLLGAKDYDSIAFCASGTHALNAALFGLLKPGQRVITTAIEHNSVLRPLHQLKHSLGIELVIVDCNAHGWIDPGDVAKLMRDEQDTLVIGHASNVTGTVQDLQGLGNIARQRGSTFIVDASQTLGYVPIDIETMGIDCLAAAGHKGLRALSGTGILYLRKDLQPTLKPLMWGGTGVASELIDAVPQWPQSIEVGNLNLPGVVSIAAAAEHLCHDSLGSWHTSWREGFQVLVEGLTHVPSLRLFGQGPEFPSIPVISFGAGQWDNHDFAAALDSSFNVEVRAGLHCAALIHQHIGSLIHGGTVRISIGHEHDLEQIRFVVQCIEQLASLM